METKSKNPKPGSKAAPPPQRGPCPPFPEHERLYGPVLAVKGSPLARIAPLTAPARAWELAVYEGKVGTATVRIHQGALAQTSGSATLRSGYLY